MRDLPAGRAPAEALGPGTRAAVRAVPGRSRGGAFWDCVAEAGRRDASDSARWPCLPRCRRDSTAARVVPRKTVAGAAVSDSGCAAARTADLCLDRDPPALSGAWFGGSLG